LRMLAEGDVSLQTGGRIFCEDGRQGDVSSVLTRDWVDKKTGGRFFLSVRTEELSPCLQNTEHVVFFCLRNTEHVVETEITCAIRAVCSLCLRVTLRC